MVVWKFWTISRTARANTNLTALVGLKGADPKFFPGVALSGYTGLGIGTGNGQERLQTPVEAHQVADVSAHDVPQRKPMGVD